MKRLVVVDDDITIREMIEIALGKSYEVRSLPSGEGVQALIESFNPHLLLLDIVLPGTDGFLISEGIRLTRTSSRLPILFMTVLSHDRPFLAVLSTGGNSVITKPFEIPELKRRIEAMTA